MSVAGSLTSATQNADGNYVIVATGMTDSTKISLAAPASLSIDLLIKQADLGFLIVNVT